MWTVEDFPGAENVPWQLLIRARFVREVDAFIASTIVNKMAQVASQDVAVRVATAASKSMKEMSGEKLSPTARNNALIALADFIDICPPWPWGWPRPGPRPPWWSQDGRSPFEDLSTPYEGLVLEGALQLLAGAGSPQLQDRLGGVLKEVGHL